MDLSVFFKYRNSSRYYVYHNLFPEHAIIESHPENTMEDLRLDTPFPELVSYMDKINVNTREIGQKTPWLVLLFKAIQKFITPEDGNSMDTTECHPCLMKSKEKQEFKKFLKRCEFLA